MTRPDPSAAAAMPVIDLGRALKLLAAAAEQPAGRLVGQALSLAQVGDDVIEALGHAGVYQLYAQSRLPVRLTLGGLVVLDAAQRAQDRGYARGDAVEYASDVAARFVDLLPDAAFPSAAVAGDQSRNHDPPVRPVPASHP
jgi:hypothetical protein